MDLERTSKRSPIRRCVVCNQRTEKDRLIRIATNGAGEICIDREMKLQSRGCYICSDPDCIGKAAKKKVFSRCFKRDVGDKIYEELRSEYVR